MLSQAEMETEGSGLPTIFGLLPTPRVQGIGQITWWIMMTKQIRGHSGKKLHKIEQ